MGRKATGQGLVDGSDPDSDVLRLTRPSIPLRERAADRLRHAIISGTLAPGTRLVESTLASRMGVSRASIRETLSLLAAEKLVVVVPNKGFSVATISWAEAQEIYNVRKVLEGEAAFMFALRCQKEELTQMQRALKDFERAIGKNDILKLLSTTFDFYRVMLDGCGNQVLAELFNGLIARINVLRVRSMSQPGRARHSLAEMWTVLDAFEKGNPREARAAAIVHVEAAAAAAMESFKSLNQSTT